LNWSGLPVVHVRPTVFLENFFFYHWAADTIRSSGEIRLPFGDAKTSPIATHDVARVVAAILLNPTSYIGRIFEITGPHSQDLNAIAAEYSSALGRPIKYVNMPFEDWVKLELSTKTYLPEHVLNHLKTMAKLHSENRYDRMVNTVEEITGTKPMSVKEWVQDNIARFQ